MPLAEQKKLNKAEQLLVDVADAVNTGEEVELPVVDFSNPDRPKSCLEVDFPILPVNALVQIQRNNRYPIYQMSKWFARREAAVFRATLLAAATVAPDDPAESGSFIWKKFYGNHKVNKAFNELKVIDVFMGGGTTLIEGSRLGMQMIGCDLNPVPWFVVRNEFAANEISEEELKDFFRIVESAVKPQIIPFHSLECPRGHKGVWKRKSDGEVRGESFNPLELSPDERERYEFVGPELVNTFWCKHGPCISTECSHVTPIMSSPVIAMKTLTVKCWHEQECNECGTVFDLEQKETRLAPKGHLVVGEEEKPYATMDLKGNYRCPACNNEKSDQVAAEKGKSLSLGKAKNKKIKLTVLLNPKWLAGTSCKGGSVSDTAEDVCRFVDDRMRDLQLIEFRGELPDEFTCSDIGITVNTTKKHGGTVPGKSKFKCQEATCGRDQDMLTSIRESEKSGPMAPYAVQGFCPECKEAGYPYSGKFYAIPPSDQLKAAVVEWESRKDGDLEDWWPREELPYGFMTHHNNGGIPNHGYTHWWTMFNPRQLLVLSQLLKAILTEGDVREQVREFALGAFQNYLRNQNMFCFWHITKDHFAPLFSNSNYHPKSNVVETGVFTPTGYGPWVSTHSNLFDAIRWANNPWETVPKSLVDPKLADRISGKSAKTFPSDPPENTATLYCQSSSQLQQIDDETIDIVCTDPPFAGLIHYSELADFFHVWLRIALKEKAKAFNSPDTPKALEAVSNKARHPDDPDGFYQRILTECWRESFRILKPGGVLAFTFHHSEDEPWIQVLESLFDAGFYLEAAYPVRSDETKGEGSKPGTIGSQKVEYDILHVCRKRLDDPKPISWARLRRKIVQDVRQIQEILEQHQKAGLGEADIQVIRRGKALEYFSRHYGKVYIERGREDEFTVKDALVGINQLLDDESGSSNEAPPFNAEPYTRQFLRLFFEKDELPRDQIQKFLRGTGVSPNEFEDRGWCNEKKKVFYLTDPLEWAKAWKGKPRKSMARDFDQTWFLIGACYEDSGINVKETLNSNQFTAHPAIPDLLDWFVLHGSDQETKDATDRARTIYKNWVAKNKPAVEKQASLFDMDSGD